MSVVSSTAAGMFIRRESPSLGAFSLLSVKFLVSSIQVLLTPLVKFPPGYSVTFVATINKVFSPLYFLTSYCCHKGHSHGYTFHLPYNWPLKYLLSLII